MNHMILGQKSNGDYLNMRGTLPFEAPTLCYLKAQAEGNEILTYKWVNRMMNICIQDLLNIVLKFNVKRSTF